MCGCEFDEGPKVFEQTLRIASLRHVCCECAASINPREWYHECEGLWDGLWSRFKTCLKCHARREAWHAYEGCRPPIEDLRNTIQDCMTGMPATELWKYAACVRKARCEIRSQIESLKAARLERYRRANAMRKAKAFLGAGI